MVLQRTWQEQEFAGGGGTKDGKPNTNNCSPCPQEGVSQAGSDLSVPIAFLVLERNICLLAVTLQPCQEERELEPGAGNGCRKEAARATAVLSSR